MKRNFIMLLALVVLPYNIALAQSTDDDMYFVPSKKKAKVETPAPEVRKTVSSTPSSASVDKDKDEVDFHIGNLRDVDEYNRRGNDAERVTTRLIGDTLYVTTTDSTGAEVVVRYNDGDISSDRELADTGDKYRYDDEVDGYYDDDYYYSTRLYRFRGMAWRSPFLWDVCYGWYDPWYDPWYGWYMPYYHYGFYSWFDWGWGWHHHPGWDCGWGHHGYYRDCLPHRPTLAYRNHGERGGRYMTGGNIASTRAGRVGSTRMGSTTRSNSYATTRSQRTVGGRTTTTRGTTGYGTLRGDRTPTTTIPVPKEFFFISITPRKSNLLQIIVAQSIKVKIIRVQPGIFQSLTPFFFIHHFQFVTVQACYLQFILFIVTFVIIKITSIAK